MSSRRHACRQPQRTQCRSHQWVGYTHCGLAGQAVAYPQRSAPFCKACALAAVRLRVCSQILEAAGGRLVRRVCHRLQPLQDHGCRLAFAYPRAIALPQRTGKRVCLKCVDMRHVA